MRSFFGVFIFFSLLTYVLAEVPLLNNTTVEMAKSDILNKCINNDGRTIYTQFECEKNSTKVDDAWIENANLTFIISESNNILEKSSFFADKNLKKIKEKNANMSLEEMLETKNITELLSAGFQAYFLRASLLNSL